MKINFGRYFFADSFIHHIDGRIKFLSFLLILTTIFLKNNFIPYLFLLVFLLVVFLFAKLPWRSFTEIFQTVLFMTFFLFIFNLINVGSNDGDLNNDNNLWKWNFLLLSWSGIFLTLYYSLRVFLVVLLTVILISTTSPKVLTFSIESLLSPLKIIKFPVHIFAMIISLTLRLIPNLIEEANNILEAQSSRGLDFKSSSWRIKLKVLISLLIPLIISIFKRANEMAIAMESRGYNPYKKRSRYYHFFLKKTDLLVLGFVLTLFVLLVCYLYLDLEYLFDWFPNKWLVHKS